MSRLFGDKSRFAAEVGEFWGGSRALRRVDLWAADRWLTCDDNTAFVPQFCISLRGTIHLLRSGRDFSPPFPRLEPAELHRHLVALDDGLSWHYRFPDWGPTTDGVRGHIFRTDDQLVFPFEFWRANHPIAGERGVVFVAELPQAELVDVLEQMLAVLESGEDA